MVESHPTPADLAYYYGDTYWGEDQSDWIKSILLFFDGVAMLVPRFAWSRPAAADPGLAGPLVERGLLRLIDPDQILDKTAVEGLASLIETYLTTYRGEPTPTATRRFLSLSRIGYNTDRALSEEIMHRLRRAGLLHRVSGSEAELDGAIRVVILFFLSQVLRRPGREMGMNLLPITDAESPIESVLRLATPALTLSTTPATFVHLDLQEVSLDLSIVPLDEVLEFKRLHGQSYREYRRSLHEEAARLSLLTGEQFDQALRDRVEKLRDEASDLRRNLRVSFGIKNTGALALGLSGASIAGSTGNWPAAAVSAIAAFWGLFEQPTEAPTSFSYLFSAARQLSSR